MERLTKLVLIASSLAALVVEARLGSAGYPPLLGACAVGFAGAALAGRLVPAVATPVVLATVYVSPAAFLLWTGRNHFTFEALWMSALAGLVLGAGDAWRWHVPAPWRWPLAGWGLVVSVAWPIVLLREVDFAPWTLGLPRVALTSIGIGPADAAVWIAYSALAHLLGLLWIDALYARYREVPFVRLRREVLFPLAGAALVACTVGIYQALVDLRFLSGHLWPHMERAAGTMMDANVFGMVAALWAAPLVALTSAAGGGRAAAVAVVAALLAVLGVWASGSRTALLAVAIGVAVMAAHAWRILRAWQAAGPLAARRAALVVAGIVAAVGIGILVMASTPGITAFERARHLVPGLETSLGGSLRLLWDRLGYGAAAVQMLREHPAAGVGVGGFHTLVHDVARAAGGYDLPPDNAQNWFRHLLAELGLVGSLPWIAWVLLFAAALAQRSSAGADPVAARLLRGSLVALGVVSLVGMPGQSPIIVVTFWTLAFWYLRVAPESPRVAAVASRLRARAVWAMLLAVVALHAAATLASARGDLRPSSRAARYGWDYRYGVYDSEPDADGGVFRWTMREAVMVVAADTGLRLEGWVDHPDADERPVRVWIWANGLLVADARLRRGDRVRVDVPAPPGGGRIVVRTRVDRTWRPSDHGSPDRRDLGLALKKDLPPS